MSILLAFDKCSVECRIFIVTMNLDVICMVRLWEMRGCVWPQHESPLGVQPALGRYGFHHQATTVFLYLLMVLFWQRRCCPTLWLNHEYSCMEGLEERHQTCFVCWGSQRIGSIRGSLWGGNGPPSVSWKLQSIRSSTTQGTSHHASSFRPKGIAYSAVRLDPKET